MKLDTVEQRHKFIDDMIKKAFEFEESLIHESEVGDDWNGAMRIVENVVVIEELIRTEEIFIDTFFEMSELPVNDDEGARFFLAITNNGLIHFVDTVLLDRIEYAFDELGEWSFVSAGGIKFKKNFRKKLDALIKAYQDVYDL